MREMSQDIGPNKQNARNSQNAAFLVPTGIKIIYRNVV